MATPDAIKKATKEAADTGHGESSQAELQQDVEEQGPDPRDDNPSPDLPTGERDRKP
jgi:hypothetical protein